jgi:hypothetical protein
MKILDSPWKIKYHSRNKSEFWLYRWYNTWRTSLCLLVPPSTYKKSSRTTQPIWDLKIGEKTNIMKDIFYNLIAKKDMKTRAAVLWIRNYLLRIRVRILMFEPTFEIKNHLINPCKSSRLKGTLARDFYFCFFHQKDPLGHLIHTLNLFRI